MLSSSPHLTLLYMAQSFAQLYFGKPIDDITADDLTAFFAEERPESINLEFKSFAQHESDLKLKEKGVIRTVCAFLNSEGGLLIWGAPEGTKNSQGEKVFVGDLSPVTKYYTKDSFISKLITRVEDVPSGIRFKDIKIGDDQFVYLIDVPESSIKPHQFEDRYWTRLDGQSKAAPHYLIRALFREEKKPVLKPTITVDDAASIFREKVRYADLGFKVRVENLTESINEDKPYVALSSEEGTFLIKELGNYHHSNRLVETPDFGVLAYGLSMEFDIMYRIDREKYVGRNIIPFTIRLVTGGLRSTPVHLVKKYRVAFLTKFYSNIPDIDVQEIQEEDQ